ncbi:hypothetical protein [Brevibacillus nitrificans]|nr:hypothetical protein [Brevibacillus nitrificans]
MAIHQVSWICDWLDKRKQEGRILQEDGRLRPAESFVAEVIRQLQEF